MKILIIDTYYDPFLEQYYGKKGSLIKTLPYEDHINDIFSQCFGTADFYSKNLKKVSIDAREVIFNDDILQNKWLEENQRKINRFIFSFNKQSRTRIKRDRILMEQIKVYNPDIIYCQSLKSPGNSFLSNLKKKDKNIKLIVGQIASPVMFDKTQLSSYDLILTSFPHFVEKFREIGIKSEYFKIGFETTVLDKVIKKPEEEDVSFVGGFTKHHTEGNKTLEYVGNNTPIKFWGYGLEKVPHDSIIRKKYQGEAWGLDMYNILHNSKITINRHINTAENYANNMRLYEATGVGTMLITDQKDNLGELFEIEKEVVTYTDEHDLVAKINYYLENEMERKSIAKAGQKRTLEEHSYKKRMVDLKNILYQYLH